MGPDNVVFRLVDEGLMEGEREEAFLCVGLRGEFFYPFTTDQNTLLISMISSHSIINH